MKKNTRTNLLIALAYALTLTTGMYLGYRFLKDQGFSVRQTIATNTTDAKKEEIIQLIGDKYVDAVNADSLQHLPIDSLLHQLDPHSIYLPPLKADEFAESLDGNFEGIGITYYILNDTLLITNVVKDGPAYIAGVKLGDQILKIDTVEVSGKGLPREQMTGRIKGRAGTAVELLLQRRQEQRQMQVNVKRERVVTSSIDAGYMLSQETGYVRISKFGASTAVDFEDIIRVLKARGMRKLILDLRDNGGGYLNAATGIANQLFPEDKLIVYTEGKHEPRTDYISLGGGAFEQGKLVVLINEHSASASEIIAGAVQDQDRGVIVGRRSFGKGLVQEQFAFNDGSALNLTVARYYTPLGRSIQKSYKKGYKAYQQEITDRFTDGELTAKQHINRDSLNKLIFTTASGKKVYGGGGIQPDVYIKLDTSGVTRLYNKLVSSRVIFDFVFDVLTRRYSLSDIDQKVNEFAISEQDIKDLVKYAQSRDITVDPRQLALSKALLLNDLKVLLYKFYQGDTGYYKAQNVNDPMIKAALGAL